MNLADVQREFQNWLVNASEASAQLLGNNVAGLAVYQNNYRAQLVGCLEGAFPNLRQWLGDEAFLAACITHIDNHPPHAWTLDAYPGGFQQTLNEVFAHNPDVHELAWIEWSLSEAFVAADATPLRMEALASVDWDTAYLQLTPSLRCHALTTNAEAIWSALWQQTPLPEASMLDEAGGLLVWRRQFTSRLRQVDALELHALQHLQNDGSFAGLCEFLVARLGEEEGVGLAGEFLAGWIGSELIVGVISG
ncbi:DNA-binding domain-containing protein [Pseudomonas sp. 7P_10.2_Bac1]|uniref:HvfC/BufC N-terminal domain-containing protein n=1 Tax=Pseudomonas sp. 7P_10.2_Bac1 TaxID=2971614 RepID=UPI0021C99EED|nr:DNA-binding domain-containing protein [Pseudomonas sp. 7P_10.2_Bac1]MCU1726840.1 DNA-binding domain-containing protein [Pseudomonas sp. 7P_10.2_Bac1]